MRSLYKWVLHVNGLGPVTTHACRDAFRDSAPQYFLTCTTTAPNNTSPPRYAYRAVSSANCSWRQTLHHFHCIVSRLKQNQLPPHAMPRPRRTRPGAADVVKTAPRSAADTASDNDDGAQARGRTRNTRSTGSRLSIEESAAVRTADRSRDAALDRLANEDITTSSGTGADEDTGSSVEVGRRAMATPAQRRDTTGLDLADDDVFGDLDDSFGDGDIPNAATRSADNSSLTLSHFKTRSRQSSVIGRNDPPIRPSSRGANSTPGVSSSFNIGAFRRRAREPSILGTSRKTRPEVTTTTQASDSGSEVDFAPEAESTPLNNRRRTRPAPEAERETVPGEASMRTTRKRKSEDAQDDGARPGKAPRVEAEAEPEQDSDSDLSSLGSPQRLPPALRERPVTPLNLDEPPASSGSEEEDDVWPDIHTLAKKRRRPSVNTPVRADHLSDVSSPPSLTHSPNFPATKSTKSRGRAASRREAPVTTADLANLLPKRRYKKTAESMDLDSEEEVDTSGLAQDDDELAHLDTRASRRRKGSRQPSRAGSARPSSRGGRAAHSALKSIQAPASTASRSTRARTLRSAGKENEHESEEDEEEESAFQALPDDTFDASTVETGGVPSAEELKKAAKKFVEVDKWELEFEEVAEPASPQDAR